MLVRALDAGLPAAWASADEAHAILAVIAKRERDREPRDASGPIPLSVNEIRYLFAKVSTNTVRIISYSLRWPTWAPPTPNTGPDKPLRQTRKPDR